MKMMTLLFGFQGRLNRAKYWLAVLIWVGVWMVGAVMMFATNFAAVFVIIAVLVFFALFISSLGVAVRRLHDRNKSGLWLLLLYVLPGILDGVGRGMGDGGIIFSLISFAISIWAFVELGCLSGTMGPNQYGPDPLGGIQTAVFD